MKLFTAISMEIKGLRIYRMQLFISLILIPFSYAFVVLLSSPKSGEGIGFIFSGMIVASLVGSYISLLSMRVSNIMKPSVLELYAALPVNTGCVVVAQMIVYTLFVLPQLILCAAIAAFNSETIMAGRFIFGIILSIYGVAVLGASIGALIRNPFKAQGIISLISWLLLLVSPTYYSTTDLGIIYKVILLVNPVTHFLNIVRSGLGYSGLTSYVNSLIYVLIMSVLLTNYLRIKVQRMFMLEKF
jgi:ABC-2 type transport system permease protein